MVDMSRFMYMKLKSHGEGTRAAAQPPTWSERRRAKRNSGFKMTGVSVGLPGSYRLSELGNRSEVYLTVL